MINLFVDDMREPQDIYRGTITNWVIARSSLAAQSILDSCVEINIISLDHDLGEDDTIKPILLQLQHNAFFGKGIPKEIRAHSSNPVGVQQIKQVAEWVDSYR